MKYMFFLGGHDLEMLTIRQRLQEHSIPFADKGLDWGAKTSDYASEIDEALQQGITPVCVELEFDTQLCEPVGDINHHGNRSGEPASILQVLKWIGVKPFRHDELVAANDSGYIPAMLEMGATDDEIYGIRLADRQAQGVTNQMEEEAEHSISNRVERGGVVIVNLRYSNKCSPVTDRLFQTWPNGKENLLVRCLTLAHEGELDMYLESDAYDDVPYELNYFGPGDICKAVKEKFDGWGGGKGFGNPESQAFAGCRTTSKQLEEMTKFIVGLNEAKK
ncbi:MAG: hypothetical protein V4664_02340 [Patescibacteria group bacterium]